MLHRLSASKLARARWCLFWARPDIEPPTVGTGLAATLGSAFHDGADQDAAPSEPDDAEEQAIEGALRDAALHRVSTGDLVEKWGLGDEAAAKLDGLREAWAEWWPAFSANRTWRTEVPMAYDVATKRARELPKSDEARDYSAITDTEVPGTIDLLSPDGTPIVLDYKTGFRAVASPATNRQLLHNGLCVARILRAPSVILAVATVRETGVYVRQEEVDIATLATFAKWLAERVEAVRGAEPTAGLHCKETWCPHWQAGTCPAAGERAGDVVEALAIAGLPAGWLTGPIESPAQVEALLAGFPLLEAWIKARKADLRAHADGVGGVPMSDGRIYRAVRVVKTEPRIDVPGAIEAATMVLGSDAQSAIRTVQKTTWGDLDKATSAAAKRMGGRKAGVTVKGLRAQVREAMRAAAAVKVSGYDSYGPHTEAEITRAQGPEESEAAE